MPILPSLPKPEEAAGGIQSNNCPAHTVRFFCRILSKLSKWFSINKLSLNVKKTSYMLFGNRHVNNDIKIRIDMEEIEKVHVTKFLGVYITYRLDDWKRHIHHIINKVSKSISIIYRASQKLNETALLMLYNTLILPYLSYCSEVWGRTYVTNLNPLFVKQKKFVRIIDRLKLVNMIIQHHFS